MAGFARLRAPAGVTPEDVTSIGPATLSTRTDVAIAFRRLVDLLRMRRAAPNLAELAASGQLTRPWPGVYKGAIEAGRTAPRSYATPRTYTLE